MKYNPNFRTILYFTFFLFLYASTAQTAEPICTHESHDSSNDAVCCKEVPFGGRVDTKLHLGVKTPRKPQILEPECKICQPIQYIRITFDR